MSADKSWLTDEASGIKIATDISSNLVDVGALTPNTWNPNRMDNFMRDRLVKSIQDDGFIIPILVRPNTQEDSEADFEIVDGEHRWRVGVEHFGMSQVPIVNLGPISDEDAKAITIKANTLRGEFDSVELAKIVKDLADESGLDLISASLPYTPERLQGMIDLLNTEIGDFDLPSEEDEESEELPTSDASDKPKPTDEFKSFDPDEMSFDHKCPRCGFEFNNKADA